ncbi:MAG: class I SAM-dependent methyltransferase [Gammaproteobacteria bacterium]|jgi:predicted methyltransferase|nr:class I SAM-dependent methyltransferase [Gammaproteobacteria bacterium]MBQ0775279.1 class I SAM-dependent methyltransferase [Gammaproteobacteria bacterium]
MKKFVIAVAVIASLAGCQSALRDATNASSRTPEFALRDSFRHPQETLAFFDVTPDKTVVEIWPGAGGWYTEILAPYLKDHGALYAAQFPPDSDINFYTRSLAQFNAKLSGDPATYDAVKVTYLYPPLHSIIAPPASADTVLTFRNVHNWAKAGKSELFFDAFFSALKPGGTLGVVEHRAAIDTSFEKQIESGYMTEEYVIAQAERAGFILEARSEINANPRDNHDHPAGVWSLPPSLRLGEQDREHYLAIGESDRMTLKFRKP